MGTQVVFSKAGVKLLGEFNPRDFKGEAPGSQFNEIENAVTHLARRDEVVVRAQAPVEFALTNALGLSRRAELLQKELVMRREDGLGNGLASGRDRLRAGYNCHQVADKIYFYMTP